jgi:hypothetical protein
VKGDVSESPRKSEKAEHCRESSNERSPSCGCAIYLSRGESFQILLLPVKNLLCNLNYAQFHVPSQHGQLSDNLMRLAFVFFYL